MRHYCLVATDDTILLGPEPYDPARLSDLLPGAALPEAPPAVARSLPDGRRLLPVVYGPEPVIDPQTQQFDGQSLTVLAEQVAAEWRVVPRPDALAAAKARLKARVTERRGQYETGGLAVGGVRIRTDTGSQAKIAGVLALLAADPTITLIDWEAQPGVWAALDRTALQAIGVAVGRHVQACFSRARILHALIDDAADADGLAAVDIDSGWPGQTG